MSMVGKKAPDFKASAIVGGDRAVSGFTLSQFEGKKDVLLFFYPKEFHLCVSDRGHCFSRFFA